MATDAMQEDSSSGAVAVAEAASPGSAVSARRESARVRAPGYGPRDPHARDRMSPVRSFASRKRKQAH
eukprot:7105671-Prymnesium_polylepis.1